MAAAISGSKIDLIESSGSDLPPAGTTRIIRVGGVTKQSVDGAAFAALGGGQDPAAVAITGGSITGTSVQGSTPAQLASTFLRANNDWNVTQWATMLGGAPGLTGYKEIPLLMAPMGQAVGVVTGDPGAEGGGFATAGVLRTIAGGIFQNMAGGNWAFACRMKVPSLVSGVNIQAGVVNTGGTLDALIGAIFSESSTNFVAQFDNAGTTPIALGVYDANLHDWVMTDDGTTVKVWKDGVLAGSTATRTKITSATPMLPYVFTDTVAHGWITRYSYGFVQ